MIDSKFHYSNGKYYEHISLKYFFKNQNKQNKNFSRTKTKQKQTKGPKVKTLADTTPVVKIKFSEPKSADKIVRSPKYGIYYYQR